MSLFEFLMVLVSLIIGLGIAELLSGVAQTIRCRRDVRVYWVHSTLVVVVFLALLQQWWEIWGVRDMPAWTFPGLLMMIGPAIGLFLIAHLLFPDPVSGADFRAYYYDEMRPALWLAVLTVALAVSFRPLVSGTTLFAMDNASSFLFIAIFLCLAYTRKPIVHSILVTLLLSGILADILLSSIEIR